MPPSPAFQEFQATVTHVEDPLPDHRIIRFKLDKPIDFVPGQFVQVIIEGKSHPASFSIASSPAQHEELEFAFHTVGEITGAMAMMRPGAQCTLRGPLGRFTFTAEDGDIVCLAGGVGITPFISMARFIRDLKLPNKYTLIYSGRTKQNLFFYDEFIEMAESHNNIDIVPTITRELPDGWTGDTRRIDSAMIKTHIPDYRQRTYYICGPKPFIEAMLAILKEIAIPEAQIKREMW